MKSISLLLALVLFCSIAGCDSHDIGGANVPDDFAFGLILPSSQLPADYYAESGVEVRTQQTKIGDSIVDLSSSTFYAQFRAARGNHPPALVSLNGNPLTPLRSGSDTLRLGGSVIGNPLTDNVWLLRDSTGDTASFSTSTLDGVDSVTPFSTLGQRTLRRDTSITVKWKRPASGSSGMFITWVGPNNSTYTQAVNDNFGVFEIPQDVVEKMAGKGKVYFTRYTTVQRAFKGKTISLQRLTQRVFPVTVE
jgi:hypothetical protein